MSQTPEANSKSSLIWSSGLYPFVLHLAYPLPPMNTQNNRALENSEWAYNTAKHLREVQVFGLSFPLLFTLVKTNNWISGKSSFVLGKYVARYWCQIKRKRPKQAMGLSGGCLCTKVFYFLSMSIHTHIIPNITPVPKTLLSLKVPPMECGPFSDFLAPMVPQPWYFITKQ